MSNTKKTLDFKNVKFFIGLDVHKKQWTVTVRSNKIRLKTFSMNPSVEELKRYLQQNYPSGEYYSVYEAGFCGYWIHRQLCQNEIKNIIINPADVPSTGKEKSVRRDPIDSNKLSRELENQSLVGIYIPDEFHQELKSLCRLREEVVKNQTRIKNRIKMHLHYYGIKIPPEIGGNWSSRFIDWLRSIKFKYGPAGTYLNFCLDELEEHRKRLLKIVRQLKEYCKVEEIKKIINCLQSVPGIGFLTALTFYSELVTMDRFISLDHLMSYVGLVPSVSCSDEKEINRGLTKRRNSYLRHLIVESAWVAIRKDPALLMSFNNLSKRMKKQEAIIRIAKKLLNRIRFVWKNRKDYVMGSIE